jgi:integrase
VTGFTVHDLRHTFASRLAQKGVNLKALADLMGHASVHMVGRYAHLAPSQHVEAVALLD